MPRALKFTLIGCGGLLALLVLFVGCLAIIGSNTDTAKGPEPSESEADKEEKKKGASKKKEGEETVAMGQPLTVGDVTWVVTDAHQTDRLVQQGVSAKNAKTEEGNFVVVDFDFTNNGNEAVTLNTESLKLVDSQGRESGASSDQVFYVPKDRKIFLERTNPGVTKPGEAIFQVAPDASGFRLQAGDAKMFTNQIGYVDLGF
jgi:hypothetical protein